MIILGSQPFQKPLKMLRNNVLLEPILRESKTASGIITSTPKYEMRQDCMEWKVLAVGPGRWRRSKKHKVRWFEPLLDVVVGDCVLTKVELGAQQLDDGTGRIMVNADQLLMSWRE